MEKETLTVAGTPIDVKQRAEHSVAAPTAISEAARKPGHIMRMNRSDLKGNDTARNFLGFLRRPHCPGIVALQKIGAHPSCNG